MDDDLRKICLTKHNRDGKLKKSLGWRTTAEYRRDMGYGDTVAA